MLYARIFTQILDSSLAEVWQTRHVFEDLLKLADDGVVDMTRQAVSRRTNVPLEIVNEAITALEAPDPASRDAAEEGRRLVRLDQHRDWGWRIVNWEKYESIRSTVDQRIKTRERVRRHREKSKIPPSTLPPAPEAASEAASEADSSVTKTLRALQSVTPTEETEASGSARAPVSIALPSKSDVIAYVSGPEIGLGAECAEHMWDSFVAGLWTWGQKPIDGRNWRSCARIRANEWRAKETHGHNRNKPNPRNAGMSPEALSKRAEHLKAKYGA